MQRVDTLAFLFDIFRDRIGNQFADNFFQVTFNDVLGDGVDHFLSDGFNLERKERRLMKELTMSIFSSQLNEKLLECVERNTFYAKTFDLYW